MRRPPLAAVAAMERASIRPRRQLPLAGLGALAVGEVAGGVADANRPLLAGHVACAEAGAAEAGLDDGAGGQQTSVSTPFLISSRDTGTDAGVDAQRELAVAAVLPRRMSAASEMLSNSAAGAAGDDALIHPDAAVVDLVGEVGVGLGEAAWRVGLHLGQQLLRVLQNSWMVQALEGWKGRAIMDSILDRSMAIIRS